LTKLDMTRAETSHGFPSFLPDGKHFIYFRRSTNVENTGISIGSIDAKPEEQDSKLLVLTASSAVYTPAPDPRAATRGLGFLLFLRETTLMAQPFDVAKLELKGEPVPIASSVASTNYGFGRFTASMNGGLAYIQGGSGAPTQLSWFDRAGKPLGDIGPPGRYHTLSISPDGSRVAAEKVDGSNHDIWLIDAAPGGKSDRFTFDTADVEESPIWSFDGKQVLYASGRTKTKMSLFVKPSNLSGDPVEVFKAQGFVFPSDWSRDGKTVILSAASQLSANFFGLFTLALDPTGKQTDLKPEPFLQTDQAEFRGKLSPDGRWLAYESDATGRNEIYVRPFPLSPDRTGQSMISNGNGSMPLWNRNGKELFYKGAMGIMAVDVTPGNAFKAGQPKPLFRIPSSAGVNGPEFNWDVSPDGSKFLMNVIPTVGDSGQPVNITIEQNWTAGLK